MRQQHRCGDRLVGVARLPGMQRGEQRACRRGDQLDLVVWAEHDHPRCLDARDSSGSIEAQKNFYRYLLARWGYSRAIAGWVAVVEIDGTTGYVLNSAQTTTWATKLKSYFVTNDLYRTSGD